MARGIGIILNIAIARIRGGGGDAQGYQIIRLLRHGDGIAHDRAIKLGLQHDMIRGEHQHDGIPVLPLHRHRAPADTGGRVAGHRLAEDIFLRDFRQLGPHEGPVFLIGGDKDILRGHQRGNPVHGALDHGAIRVRQIQKLLGNPFPASGPEALPPAAGHNQGRCFHTRTSFPAPQALFRIRMAVRRKRLRI